MHWQYKRRPLGVKINYLAIGCAIPWLMVLLRAYLAGVAVLKVHNDPTDR